MQKKLLIIQSLVLLAGTVFAWSTVAGDFTRFYSVEGTMSPIMTPCFYGAWAFLTALIWSLAILAWPSEKQKVHQRRLVFLLVGGTLFAWGNFTYGLVKFLANQSQPTIGCSGAMVANPFTTPCFIGALFFFAALLISLVILRTVLRNI